jgi:hypothetical protein
MIKLLASHGAKLDLKGKRGRTAMTFAERVPGSESGGEQAHDDCTVEALMGAAAAK